MKTKPNYHEVFYQRLKQARSAQGLSQKKLGIAAGMDVFVATARINRYEKGVHEASIKIAQQLADVLEVPLAYFYTYDDALAELMLAFLTLSLEERIEILTLIKSRAEVNPR